MRTLSTKDRAQILSLLVEGTGVNAACRITGFSKNTVLKLLADVGAACAAYQDRVMRNLPCKKLEADEVWSFVGMKEKNVPEELRGTLGYGDSYTWTAIDPETKLIPCWHVGTRSEKSAHAFIQDLASRLANRVQLTTDGYRPYLTAVNDAFGGDIDYAMLVKIYSQGAKQKGGAEHKYSPGDCIGAQKRKIAGHPDKKHISTSLVERQNLTMRMSIRRFTRLTNAFSKKLENHMHAVSLHFMAYNFCKIHSTIRVTPAMETGLTDHVWSMVEVVEMADTMPKREDVTVSASE